MGAPSLPDASPMRRLGSVLGTGSRSQMPTQAPPAQPPSSGTHRGLWSLGGVLILAEGGAEGLEGLAVLFVLRDGGLDDLEQAGHRPQQCSQHPVRPRPLTLPTGSAPLTGGSEAPGRDRQQPSLLPAPVRCRRAAGSLAWCSRPWVFSVGLRPVSLSCITFPLDL